MAYVPDISAMLSTPVAQIAGQSILGITPVEWSLTRGTMPYSTEVELLAEAAASVWASAQDSTPVTLRIKAPSSDSGSAVVASDVFVLEMRQGTYPSTRRLVIADRRFMWSRKYVTAAYNITKKTGDKRIIYANGQARIIQNAGLPDSFTFYKYSLKDEKRYTAKEVLTSVLDGIGETRIRLPSTISKQIEIQDLFIDNNGSAAITEVLKYMPDIDVYIALDGGIIFFNENDKRELDVISDLGPLLRSGGRFGVVNRSATRPRRVVVHFTCEHELRFDFRRPTWDLPTTKTTSRTDRRELENVLPSPDPELDVEGVKYGVGTYITFEQAYDAWSKSINHDHNNTAAAEPFDEPVVRGAKTGGVEGTGGMLKGLAYQSSSTYGMDKGLKEVDPIWQRRIKATVRHWRQTFKINDEWMNRIRSIKAKRASIVDQNTGLRAPSAVYADYIAKPSYRGIAKGYQEYYQSGWFIEGWNKFIAEAQEAPVDVRVISESAGIIRCYPLRDPYGESERIIWGKIDSSKIPSDAPDSRQATKSIILMEQAEILEEVGLTVILTCTPGTPNNSGQLFKMDVRPEDVKGLLNTHPGSSYGPEIHIRIDPSVQTARFAWDDGSAADIERVFIEGNKKSSGSADNRFLNKETCQHIAKAAAAVVYQQFLDRNEGNVATTVDGHARIRGTIQEVSHHLDTSGVARTSISMPPEIRMRDLYEFLPASTRHKILRILDD